jgi:hypothetical protein
MAARAHFCTIQVCTHVLETEHCLSGGLQSPSDVVLPLAVSLAPHDRGMNQTTDLYVSGMHASHTGTGTRPLPVLTPMVVRGCSDAHCVSFIHRLRSSVMGGGAGLRMPLHKASYSSTLMSCSYKNKRRRGLACCILSLTVCLYESQHPSSWQRYALMHFLVQWTAENTTAAMPALACYIHHVNC